MTRTAELRTKHQTAKAPPVPEHQKAGRRQPRRLITPGTSLQVVAVHWPGVLLCGARHVGPGVQQAAAHYFSNVGGALHMVQRRDHRRVCAAWAARNGGEGSGRCRAVPQRRVHCAHAGAASQAFAAVQSQTGYIYCSRGASVAVAC